jgi:hypothetical protein
MGPEFNPNAEILRATPRLPDTARADVEIEHAVTDMAAVQVYRAEGEFGDKVALAASSVSNHGMYAHSAHGTGLVAEGPALAAEFRGAVQVREGIDVGGDLVVAGRVVVSGDVLVTGDLRLLGADYAEDFALADPDDGEPGTVMVLEDDQSVRSCSRAYDPRVAGVVSGAGSFRPAIILDSRPGAGARAPLALMGKAFCKVDASYGPVGIGDLLTTSATPGHAMRVDSSAEASGAVLGKALQPLAEGRGLVPFIVSLG